MPERTLKCSFCGKNKDAVRKFISGPDVYICNECVVLCNEILVEDNLSEEFLIGMISLEDIRKVSSTDKVNIKGILGKLGKMDIQNPDQFLIEVFRLVTIETAKALGDEHLKLAKDDHRLIKKIRNAEAAAEKTSARVSQLRRELSENRTRRKDLEKRRINSAPAPAEATPTQA